MSFIAIFWIVCKVILSLWALAFVFFIIDIVTTPESGADRYLRMTTERDRQRKELGYDI